MRIIEQTYKDLNNRNVCDSVDAMTNLMIQLAGKKEGAEAIGKDFLVGHLWRDHLRDSFARDVLFEIAKEVCNTDRAAKIITEICPLCVQDPELFQETVEEIQRLWLHKFAKGGLELLAAENVAYRDKLMGLFDRFARAQNKPA